MGGNFKKYSKYYDVIYKDKDYQRECDFLEQIFDRYSQVKPKLILDFACGTGNHAICLSQRKYNVSGSDLSSGMVDIARKKAIQESADIKFRVGRMQDVKFGRKFDAALIMFASIDYLVKIEDIKSAIMNASRHLKKNGLLIFDFWNGFSVMRGLIKKSVKAARSEDLLVKRVGKKSIDSLAQLCEVDFIFSVYKGKKLIDSFKEKHLIRYFFPEEMKGYLELMGFKVLRMCEFMKLDADVSSDVWDVAVIARRL